MPQTIEDLKDHNLVIYGEDFRPPTAHVNWLAEATTKAGVRPANMLKVNNIYGIYRAVQRGQSERAAVVKLGAVVFARRVAVGVNVHETKWPLTAQGLEDRITDRVIPPDTQGAYIGVVDTAIERLDVFDTIGKAETASHRYVADIGHSGLGGRRDFQKMIVGTDALYGSHGARAKSCARPIGHTKVHRHPNQRDFAAVEVLRLLCGGVIRCIQQRRHAAIGQAALSAFLEQQIRDFFELRVVYIVALRAGILAAKLLQPFFLVHIVARVVD